MSKNYTNLKIDENTGIASVTLDGISFGNIDYTSGTLSIAQAKIAPKNSQYSPDGGTNKALILDAVNIDWNGAQLKNGSTVKATLNTTGEMLSILQTAYNYATTYTGTVKKVNNVAPDANGNVTISVGSTLSGATTTTLGGIKTKYHTTGNATIVDTNSTAVTNRNYGIETDGAYLAFVKVPWTDTDTKVTSAANHYTPATDSNSTLSATAKDGTAAWGAQIVKGVTVSRDAKGHITGISVQSAAIPTQPTSVTGNAGTATKLATARTLTIGAKGKTFDGSANVAWTLSEIGAAAASHSHDDYTTKSFVSTNYAAKDHTHDNYITTTVANTNYAAKKHEHTEYAVSDHKHTDLATKNHASTSNAYGVGTTANYGHLKISSDYVTNTSAADVALSLGGAYNMYNHFMTKVAQLQSQIDALTTRVSTLEGYHVTKEYDLTVSLTGCSSTTLKNGKISENGGSYAVTAATHYNLPSTITVKQGSTTLTAGTHYTWSSGTLRILPGITGAISVTITATAKNYTITVSGNATGNKSSVAYTSGNVQVTLTAKSGYNLTGATVSGATLVSFASNIVTFNNMTGNVTITAQTSEIVLTGVTVSKSTGAGTNALSGDTVTVTGKGSSITLALNSTPDTALNKTMSLAATDSAGATTTKLGLSTSSVTDGGTVKLTPTSGTISNAKLKISNNKGTVLKTLTVTVNDGSTTGVSVKNSANGTSSSLAATGGEVALTASVTSNKFNPGSITWTTTGGSFKNGTNTGSSVTFVAPANTSESAAAEYTITATCDGIKGTYKVTVAKKAASVKYYWYTGQTQPTTSNYTSLATQVTSYPTTFEYTNTSGKRGYTYMILHNSKTLTAVEKVSQATINFTTDTTSIPNYTIYKTTVGIAVSGVIVITIK